MKKRKSKSKKGTASKARTSASGPPVEAFADLDIWAAEVAECLPQDELGVLVGIYRRIAGDRRVTADNRRLARKQAQALAKSRSE